MSVMALNLVPRHGAARFLFHAFLFFGTSHNGTYLVLCPEWCQGHPNGHRKAGVVKYLDRLRRREPRLRSLAG